MRSGRVVWACLLAGALLIVASEACPDTLDVMVITSAAADLGTTEWALSRPGLREGNPLMGTPGARIGIKTAATAAVFVGVHELQRHRHERAAKVLKVLAIVVWSGAAVNNAIRARETK